MKIPLPFIEAIHAGTAIYTASVEVEELLDKLEWPKRGGRILDPAAGDGNMIVAAMRRLRPAAGDHAAAARVQGYEFHEESVIEARRRVADELVTCGWCPAEAERAAKASVHLRDFLIDRTSEIFENIIANPPYWRRSRLPAGYAEIFDACTPHYARGDLLHAFLTKIVDITTDKSRIGLITSDRWLINSGAGAVRAKVGARFKVESIRRLDPKSAFHRPKNKIKDTPPRVHAVSMLITQEGRDLTKDSFFIEEVPEVDGLPLGDIVSLRLAPWLGPDGMFMVSEEVDIPDSSLVPCVEPSDICPKTGKIGPIRRWAIVTGDERPCEKVIQHLKKTLHGMPARGRRKTLWHPPERFDRHLPLKHDAILVPRLAPKLRAISLPAGHLPTNHSLVIASGHDPEKIRKMLEDPRVQAQADAIAPPIESGYRSYTATLLRRLVIPFDLIPQEIL